MSHKLKMPQVDQQVAERYSLELDGRYHIKI